MRLWFIMLAWLLVGGAAHAQGWPEKTWSEYVREADLIVRARVIEGGTWGAVVEVEQTYAGTPPGGPLTIVGINDPMFPPDVLEQQTWRKGDVNWLFLDRWTGPRFPGEPQIWRKDGLAMPEGSTYAPPAPSLADIPLRDDGVHVRFVAPVMPDPASVIPRAEWEALLADLIAVHRQQRPSKLLALARSCLGSPHDEELESRFSEPADAACLGRLTMLRETRYDERLPAYAASKHVATRGALGALAVGIDDPRADKLVVDAVLDKVELAHVLTVKAGLDGKKDRLGDLLAVLLPASRWSPPPRLPVDPAIIRSEHARLQLTRAVGALQRPKDEIVFVNELYYANPAVLYPMVEALQGIRPGSWVEPVEELLQLGGRKRTRTLLEVAHELREPAARDLLERFVQREDVDEDMIRLAMWALQPIGDAGTSAMIRRRLTPRLTDDVQWDAATVDMVAAELELLRAIEGPEARDLAYRVSRLYLSWPRQLADAKPRAAWDAFVQERTRVATGVLPPGSEVQLHVVATDAQVQTGKLSGARVYVNGKVPSGLMPAHRTAVANALGIDVDHVRLCGVGPKGHRCHEKRGTVWRLHQVLAGPAIGIIGEAAGYGDRPLDPVDPTAARWFALALERDLESLTDTSAVFVDLKQAKRLRENPPPPPSWDVP